MHKEMPADDYHHDHLRPISEHGVREEDRRDDAVFDLDALRLSQDFAEELGVHKLLTSVPVRKPNAQEFVRVRAGEDWRLHTTILPLKEQREAYLVAPALRDALTGEIVPVTLYTTINR